MADDHSVRPSTGNHLHTLTGMWTRGIYFTRGSGGTRIGSEMYRLVQMARLSQPRVVTDTVRLWDVNTGSHFRTLHRAYGLGQKCQRLVQMAIPSSAGSYDRTARLWDANTGSELRTLEGHRAGVASVAV